MNRINETEITADLFTSLLRAQIRRMSEVLQNIEQGNPINGYVDENLKTVERDLRWLRKFYLNN